MKARNTLLMLIGVIVAGIAGYAVWSWMSGVEDRAYENATLVEVLVVQQEIPRGTSGEQVLTTELIARDEIPQEFRPPTAITDPNVLVGLVSTTRLVPGQVVVEGQFADPRAAQITNAARVPSGKVAVTVSLSNVEAVAGIPQPGDKVNIITGVPQPDALITPDGQVQQVDDIVGQEVVDGPIAYLYQNVDILFIGQTAAPEVGENTTAETVDSDLITFAVPPEAALRIIQASESERGIYLTLVPPDYEPQEIDPISPFEIFDNIGLTPDEGLAPAEPTE